jgi:tetratricopeptide (TPR) repeat protein
MISRIPFTSTPLKYIALIIPLVLGALIKDPITHAYNSLLKKTASYDANEISKLYEQGVELQNKGQPKEALKFFRKALITHPHITPMLVRAGAACFLEGKIEDAINYYKTAINIEPRHINAYVSLGISLARLNKHEEAVKYFIVALKVDPNNFEANLQLSKSKMELKEFDEAMLYANKAAELQPNNIHAYLNLGHVNNKKGDLDQAIVWYKKALTIDPNFPNAIYNLGYTLQVQKKYKEAIPYLLRAIELKNNYVDAHVALAQCYWGLEDFENGWKEYIWRWKMLGIDPNKMDVPLWDGSDIKGKTILLYSEQGLGDTLQFIRFTKLVKERGAKVICKVQKPLKSILASYPHVDAIVNEIPKIKFDYQAPLLNLPGILKITADKIPVEIPYLKADQKLVEFWSKQLAHDKKFRIGICWHVDPIHDVDKSPWQKRTFPIELLTPLSEIPGLSFYSLQKVNGEDHLKNLPDSFQIHTFGPRFDENHGRFMDTAAVIMNLDLIITVDTSIAHLAAGMGKKVWMLLPFSPDCRWYDNRSDTPWYPTMRLFRQPKPFDWQSASSEVFNELKKQMKRVTA